MDKKKKRLTLKQLKISLNKLATCSDKVLMGMLKKKLKVVNGKL